MPSTHPPPRGSRARRATILLIALGALGLAGCARVAGEPFQPTHNGAVPLEQGASLGQTFQVPSGEVTGVDVLVATFAAAAQPDATLHVELLDDPAGRTLAEARIPGGELDDNAWVAARFPEPVPVEDGVAAVNLTWDGDRPVALRANVPPPDFDGQELLNDPYPGGELLRDGTPATGDLAFRVRGNPTPGDALRSAAALVRGLLGGLAARPLFALLWSALLLASLGLAVLGLRRSGPGAAEQLPQGRRDEQDRGRDERGAEQPQ